MQGVARLAMSHRVN